MGKAADNERRKLAATFFNNLAVGAALAGALVPYLNSVTHNRLQTLAEIILGTISNEKIAGILGGISIFVVAIAAAWSLRRTANIYISQIED